MTKYEDLPLIAFIVAESVCGRPYTGQELSAQIRPDPSKTEALRQAMTDNQVAEFSGLCDAWCKAAYEAKADWFMKCARDKGNGGRDILYVWISHWLASYLNDPARFRSQWKSVQKLR
jgi:hypothetical protein